MIESPPDQWPVDEGDDGARLLTWRGAAGGPDASLEGVILMTLQFVAGAALLWTRSSLVCRLMSTKSAPNRKLSRLG